MTTRPAQIESPLPELGKKYFTIEEANRALVYIAPIVDDVMEAYGDVVDMRRRIEQLPEHAESYKLERSYEQGMDRLSDLVDELHFAGVELKDFEQGLIDFPSLHDGREVLLCWRSGENKVEFWHEVDTGYAGRRNVELIES